VFDLEAYKSSDAQQEVEFSAARYEPMARLLENDDLLFLKSQPGFRPEMGKKFNRERRRIFRMYLRDLSNDFYRLHAHARAVAASLPADHAPLLGMLIRQQLRFWYEMAAIEMRLSLGVSSINVRGLVDAIAGMQSEIGRVVAPAAA
jgi:hypothetical protein